MTRVYYREATGAFIVFDVTRPSTFEAVTKWKEDLDSKLSLPTGGGVAAVLLANKCDQGRDVLTNNGLKMEQFCKENGFVGWFETSAKVAELFSAGPVQPRGDISGGAKLRKSISFCLGWGVPAGREPHKFGPVLPLRHGICHARY